MSTKAIKISGWALVGVLTFLFGFSAFLKLTHNPAALAQAASMGFDSGTFWLIGLIELVCLVLFLMPRTAFLGSLLLIAYMGGAIATHLQHQQPVFIAVVVETLIWVSLFLRFPILVREVLSFTKREKPKSSGAVKVCGAG